MYLTSLLSSWDTWFKKDPVPVLQKAIRDGDIDCFVGHIAQMSPEKAHSTMMRIVNDLTNYVDINGFALVQQEDPCILDFAHHLLKQSEKHKLIGRFILSIHNAHDDVAKTISEKELWDALGSPDVYIDNPRPTFHDELVDLYYAVDTKIARRNATRKAAASDEDKETTAHRYMVENLFLAAEHGQTSVCAALLKRGIDINTSESPCGESVLGATCGYPSRNTLSTVQWLIAHGADPYQRMYKKEHTPFMMALMMGNTAICEYLLSVAPDVMRHDPYGHALSLPMRNTHEGISLLVQHGFVHRQSLAHAIREHTDPSSDELYYLFAHGYVRNIDTLLPSMRDPIDISGARCYRNMKRLLAMRNTEHCVYLHFVSLDVMTILCSYLCKFRWTLKSLHNFKLDQVPYSISLDAYQQLTCSARK